MSKVSDENDYQLACSLQQRLWALRQRVLSLKRRPFWLTEELWELHRKSASIESLMKVQRDGHHFTTGGPTGYLDGVHGTDVFRRPGKEAPDADGN